MAHHRTICCLPQQKQPCWHPSIMLNVSFILLFNLRGFCFVSLYLHGHVLLARESEQSTLQARSGPDHECRSTIASSALHSTTPRTPMGFLVIPSVLSSVLFLVAYSLYTFKHDITASSRDNNVPSGLGVWVAFGSTSSSGRHNILKNECIQHDSCDTATLFYNQPMVLFSICRKIGTFEQNS